MAITFKPFRDYSEHDVVNLFSLNASSGDKGTLVKIVGNGFINNQSHGIASNMNGGIPNVYTPRYEVKAKVGACPSGVKPFGIQLYDVREKNQFDYPLIFDPVRKAEMQCVVSGEAVPVVRKGIFLMGPFASGVNPGPGSGAAPSDAGDGDWKVTDSLTAAGCFAEFLGTKDADGYALASVNCY